MRFGPTFFQAALIFIVMFGVLNTINKFTGPILRPVAKNSSKRCVICGRPATVTTLGPMAEKNPLATKLFGSRSWCYEHKSAAEASSMRSATYTSVFWGCLFAVIFLFSTWRAAERSNLL
jgi:hypothetical protein